MLESMTIFAPAQRSRRAFTCENKDCNPPKVIPIRVFLTPDDPDGFIPNCPSGHGKMKQQINMPYRGGETQ